MKESRYYLVMDRYDRGIIRNALNDMRNRQLAEKQPTSAVDEVLEKVVFCPTRKVRVIEREPEHER